VVKKVRQLIGEGLTPNRAWGTPEVCRESGHALALGYFDFSTGSIVEIAED
jgi:hypothetical protein